MADDDAELEAIRRRMLSELMTQQARPTAPAQIVDTDDASFTDLVTRHPVVAVDCWADWCAPCKVLEPRFRRAGARLAGRAVFARLDVDKNPKVSAAFAVQSIPTVLVFRDGRLVDRIVGAVAETELETRVQRVLPHTS